MSTDFSVIRQPAGQRTLALRESYLAICGGDKCEAHLLNANERWYAWKLKERQQARSRNKASEAGGEIPEADESLWVFMSTPEWVEELLGIYDEKTIRRKLTNLVERNFLATRNNPKKKWDRKLQWMFNRSKVQEAVDAWEATRTIPDIDPSPPDQEASPTVSIQEEPEKGDLAHLGNQDTCIRENAQMHPGKVPDASGQSTESIRENARSNTTGIFSQGSSSEDFRGGVHNVIGNAHAQGNSLSAPVAGSSNDERSSSNEAALQTSTHEAGPAIDPLTDLPMPQVPSLPTATLEQPSPDGVAANAALDPDFSQEELDLLFGTQPSTESFEDVPGGGAAGGPAAEAPRGPMLPPVALTVAELLPIPPTELASRPVAAPESETWKALREVLGNQMPIYLSENTRTGDISRELWLRLTPSEIRQVTVTARLEIASSKASLITVAMRGLDRLIGAVKAPKVDETAAPAGVNPRDVDPSLAVGARCTVDGKLGVVFSVQPSCYQIDLDIGENVTIDRSVAARLSKLKSSSEPLLVAAPAATGQDIAPAKVGTVYRDLATGDEVRVTATQGASRVLSNGRTLLCYELTNPSRFERLTT